MKNATVEIGLNACILKAGVPSELPLSANSVFE
jgi:hypothetical protein